MTASSAIATFSLLLSLLQLISSSFRALTPALALNASSLPSGTALFFQDVVREICVRQRWNSDAVSLSRLDLRRARFGTAQRQEFRIRFGKIDLFFWSSDEVASWRKLNATRGVGFVDLARAVGSLAVIGSFKVEGPFELRADGDHEFSLSLPQNATYTGLRHVLVGEGITVEVDGAQEVSLLYGPQFNSSGNIPEVKGGFWPYWQSLCTPLLPIRVSGSASLIAYRTRNPITYLESNFPSMGTIELLPEKCYGNFQYKRPSCPIDSLSSRIATLERVLRGSMGERMRQNGFLGFVKAKIKAVTVFRLQIQLERNITGNETHLVKLEKWRTRPTVERVWFEVMARLDGERLMPLVINKVRPFSGVDTVAWSSLLSNISFTKFPSTLVPPDALTLDVKW
ncbi:hypothetical protein BT93_F1455 [Corymbia citriodora subsp. variegata]|nr:hypothetical protein BT93_F1455 [Corymbia citriodora subsp. variegata]